MFVVGIWSARLLTCRERVRLISLHDLSFVRVNHNNCGLYYCHYTPPPAENTVPVFPNLALISKQVAFVTSKFLSEAILFGEHVVYKNCSECQKQFLYTTCSPQVWAWNFHVLNL